MEGNLIIEENPPSPEPAPEPRVVMAEDLPDIDIKFLELENKIDKLESVIKLCCPDFNEFDEKARKIQSRFKSNKIRKASYEELGLTLERYKTKGEIIISPPITFRSGDYHELSLKPLSRDFSDQLFGHEVEKDLVLYNCIGYPVYFSMEIYDEKTKKPEMSKWGSTHCQPGTTLARLNDRRALLRIPGRDLYWGSRQPDKNYHKNKHYRIGSVSPDDDKKGDKGFKFWYGKSILRDEAWPPPIPYDTVYGIIDENIIIIEKYKRLDGIYEEIKKYAVQKDGRIYTGKGNMVIFENKEDEEMFKKLHNIRKKLENSRASLKIKKKYKRKKKSRRKRKKSKKSKKYNK